MGVKEGVGDDMKTKISAKQLGWGEAFGKFTRFEFFFLRNF